MFSQTLNETNWMKQWRKACKWTTEEISMKLEILYVLNLSFTCDLYRFSSIDNSILKWIYITKFSNFNFFLSVDFFQIMKKNYLKKQKEFFLVNLISVEISTKHLRCSIF